MRNFLAIGTAATNAVSHIKKYSKKYRIYSISNQNEKNTKYNFKIEKILHPEECEKKNLDAVDKFLSGIKNNLTVFVSGASFTSGITLRALKPLYDRGVKIDVAYIMPERDILSDTALLQENAVRGILQEYARSGIFEKIHLFSVSEIETMVGETSIMDRYSEIDSAMMSTIYMIDVLKGIQPVSNTISRVGESCRIGTLGIVNLDTGEEKMFFPLKEEVELLYHFGINEQKLKTEKNLFRKITDIVKSRKTENRKISFAIYPTEYPDDYVYVEYYTPKTQNFN